MPRPRRLHVKGGIYLVTLKGNAHQIVVADAKDRDELERLLALALKRCHARAHAYCWLSDRILLAVEVSDAPLGQLVQRFASPYALRTQQRNGRSGHLFARRYDATLIEPGPSLLHLVRYIHRAPIRAERARAPDDYDWSSHHAYLGRERISWLTTQQALRLLSHNRADARRKYTEFMAAEDVREASLSFGASEDFKRAMAQRTREPLPFESLDQLIDSVCRNLHVKREDVLSISRHRRLSLARAVIAWHATRMGLATLKQVAGRFGRHTSTLSVGMDRYQRLRPDLFKIPKAYQPPMGPPMRPPKR